MEFFTSKVSLDKDLENPCKIIKLLQLRIVILKSIFVKKKIFIESNR